MTTWIALFRGINVGGHNRLPMAELRGELEALGLRDVRTYIQSGNVVFEAPAARQATALGKTIDQRVEQRFGFRPQLFLLSAAQLRAAIEANPFPQAVGEPKSLHVNFLAEPARDADLAGLEALKAASEAFVLTDSVFYLHAPDGIGRSKLAAKAESLLGVVATGRNYRTVETLWSMVNDG